MMDVLGQNESGNGYEAVSGIVEPYPVLAGGWNCALAHVLTDGRSCDAVIHKLKVPRNILNIPPVEGTRQEEPFCCLEVACT